MASTSDEIKHMIELAQQQITHHKQEQQKWESTLQRLQKAQTAYTQEQKQHQQQVANLETELSKACTTGPAAQIAAQSGQISNTQQRSINTNFSAATARPYQQRPSLLSTPGQQAAFNSQQAHQPVQIQVLVEPVKPKTKVAKVLYPYPGLPENNVMSLSAGEFLAVHSDEGDWWLCQRTTDKINGTGVQQFAPRNYLQLVEAAEDDVPPPARPTNVTVVSASAPKPAYSTGTLKPGQFPTTSSNQNHYQAPAAAAAPMHVTPSPVHRQAPSGNTNSFNLTPTNATAAVARPGPPPLNNQASSNPPPPPQNGGAGGPPPFRGSVTGPPPPPQSIGGGGPPPFRGTPGAPPPPPKTAEKRCQALFDYTSTDSSLLSFKRNDIFILQGENAGSLWWLVKNSEGSTGYVPSNHVKAL